MILPETAPHPSGVGNPAASAARRNQLTVDLQMLGDRQQDAFCSIETGGREQRGRSGGFMISPFEKLQRNKGHNGRCIDLTRNPV
jgi:hypothetical protein